MYKVYVAGPDYWRDVPGYEGRYQVSGHGQVRSTPRLTIDGKSIRGRTLRPWVSKTGYPCVRISRELNKFDHFSVHKLVLLTFKGERPVGHYGCHRNDVSDDNRVVNLYWGSPTQNCRDAVANGRLGGHQKFKTHCAKGHEFTEENTRHYVGPRGRKQRICRTCEKRPGRKKSAPQPRG